MKSQRLALSLLLTLTAGLSAAQTQPVTVSVFPDHYAIGANRYDDLDRIEDEMRARRPGAVGLMTCGAGTNRSLKAIAHRLSNYPLQIVTLSAQDARCDSHRLVSAGAPRPMEIDDARVDSYWRQVSP